MDRKDAVDLLRRLVEIRSVSHREGEAAAWLAGRMREAGYERAFVDEAGNAVGEMGPLDASHTVVLLGHIDTVPGDIPVRIESTAEGDVLFGRGAVDAKGPLAAFVVAVARLGSTWARRADVKVVVIGAVEEEAATSKGARFVASRFVGPGVLTPAACIIGEPSQWNRCTLGYKGRLLVDLVGSQPMAHTAGPDASIATAVVDLWNWVTSHAAAFNRDRGKVFDQLTPSLRRIVTSTTSDMHDVVEAQVAWRLPTDFAAAAFVSELVEWAASHLGAAMPSGDPDELVNGDAVTLRGVRTTVQITFSGWERAWRADRQNVLVRSFLAAIRAADPTVQPGFVVKTGTSDMNVVGPLWNCPILAYGPGDSALDHTPNEHISLDEFWRAVGVLETTLSALADTLSARQGREKTLDHHPAS